MRGKLAKKIRRNTDFMTQHSTPQYGAIAMNFKKPNRLTVVLVECDRALYQAVKHSILETKRAA